MKRFHNDHTGYGKDKVYKDWVDFLEQGRRPSLGGNACEVDWGGDAFRAVEKAWSHEADCRGTAEDLATALGLDTGITVCGDDGAEDIRAATVLAGETLRLPLPQLEAPRQVPVVQV